MVLKATWQVLLAIDKRLNWQQDPQRGQPGGSRTAGIWGGVEVEGQGLHH